MTSVIRLAATNGEPPDESKKKRGRPRKVDKIEKITLRLPPEIYFRFQAAAEKEGMSMNSLIWSCCEAYLLAYENKNEAKESRKAREIANRFGKKKN